MTKKNLLKEAVSIGLSGGILCGIASVVVAGKVGMKYAKMPCISKEEADRLSKLAEKELSTKMTLVNGSIACAAMAVYLEKVEEGDK